MPGGGLPEGLVSNKDVVSGEIERVDRVEAEDVQRLWKVYSSKKAALSDNVGERLENFFWRIWSSSRVRERVTGTQVAMQFNSIDEGGYIRTTPTPSPRSSRSLGSYYRAARIRTIPRTSASQAPSSSTEARPSSESGDDEISSVTPTPTSPLSTGTKSSATSKEMRRSTASTRPPPILKASSSGSGSCSSSKSSKTTAASTVSSRGPIPSHSAEDDEAIISDDDPTPTDSTLQLSRRSAPTRRATTTRFNEEVAVSIPKASMPVIRSGNEKAGRSSSGESSQKSGRRKPVVIANTGASKIRPSVGRRKSSQSSSLGNSRNSSYSNLIRSHKQSTSGPQDSLGQKAEASSLKRSRAASPHPSKSRIPLSIDPSSSEENSDNRIEGESEEQSPPVKTLARSESSEDDSEDSDNEKTEEPKALVDPNFRSKFIGKTRSAQGSFTNIPSLLRRSVAAVPPASASYQATALMQTGQPTPSAGSGKGREAFTDSIAPLKAPAAAGPEPTSGDDLQPLSRTKSQLTMLLERERNRSTGQEHADKKPRKP